MPRFPPDPIRHIIKGGSINILAGASGTGKTALIAGWAKAFRDKSTINGHPVGDVSGVFLISGDRSYVQDTKHWFDRAGFSDIPVYSIQDDLDFNLSRLLKKQDRVSILESCLDAVKVQPHMMGIVDPMSLFLGGNLLDYDACLVACSLIRRVCIRRQISLIGLGHASKQIADPKRRYLRLQDRIAGSTAIFGYTDTQMYFAAPEELSTPKQPVTHHTFYWNPHTHPAETFKCVRDPETGLFLPGEKIIELTDAERAEAEAGETLDKAKRLLTWISDQAAGTSYGDLAKFALQHSELEINSDRTLRRRLKALQDHGYIEKVGLGNYRRLGTM